MQTSEYAIQLSCQSRAVGFWIILFGLNIKRLTAAKRDPRALASHGLYKCAQHFFNGEWQIEGQARLQVRQEWLWRRDSIPGKKGRGQLPNPLCVSGELICTHENSL